MFRYSLLLITAFVAVCSQLVQAQAPLIDRSYDKKNKTTAKVTATFSRLAPSGYMPIRLEVKNGTKKPRTWSLSCKSQAEETYYYRSRGNQSVMESQFTFTCPGNSKKTVDLYVPIVTAIPHPSDDNISSNLTVTLSSGGASDTSSLSSSQLSSSPAVLLSSTLFNEHASNLDSLMTTGSHGHYSGHHNVEYASSFVAEQLPSDWRAYVGYDSLVCTDLEWMRMGKATQSAILEWNRLGGRLLILTLNSASNLKSLDIAESSNDNKVQRSFGSVELHSISQINARNIPDTIRIKVGTPVASTPKSESVLSDYDDGTWNLKKTMGKLSFNPFFLIMILIAFGILVGPVNLFVFAKAGKRHKLFITTPIIAIAASLVLVLIIIFQDGFGGHGNRIQLVEVRADGGENKAYIMQEQIARTGIMFGASFETSQPTYITPVPLEESRFSRITRQNQGGSANYEANHGENGLKASGDWFQSRSLHGHYLESVVSTRGRITLKSSAGAPVLNSSFDYPISKIIFRDMAGEYWSAGDLTSGDSAKLKKLNAVDALALINAEKKKMNSRMKEKFSKLWERKGHFVAITDQAPAIDTLDSISWQNTTSVITGPVVK